VNRAACGTQKAASRHRYLGEPLDAACRAAEAARVREHRAKHGRRDQLINQARNRALARLGREYPDRLAELYEQAKVEIFAQQYGGAR
jgi:hypothetical protein